MISPARPPSLRLIRGALDTSAWSAFGGRSGSLPSGDPGSALAKAFGSYAVGPLPERVTDALPGKDDAFLVIDSMLRVQAVSETAARLLGVRGEDVLGSPVAKLLGPADAEARAPEDFLHLLRRASTDGNEPSSVFVRPRNAFGVRMVARIAPCGPSGGALVLLRTGALRVEIQHGRR